jgi:beta-glucosidase
LKVKFELGLFDDPYKYCDENRELTTVGKPEFQEVVLDMAKKSIVLLKKRQGSLKKKQDKIALIGALANDKTSP